MGFGKKEDKISSFETEENDVWQANITVNDGIEDSKPIESNYLEIL